MLKVFLKNFICCSSTSNKIADGDETIINIKQYHNNK